MPETKEKSHKHWPRMKNIWRFGTAYELLVHWVTQQVIVTYVASTWCNDTRRLLTWFLLFSSSWLALTEWKGIPPAAGMRCFFPRAKIVPLCESILCESRCACSALVFIIWISFLTSRLCSLSRRENFSILLMYTWWQSCIVSYMVSCLRLLGTNPLEVCLVHS